jgi:hypothetical protein
MELIKYVFSCANCKQLYGNIHFSIYDESFSDEYGVYHSEIKMKNKITEYIEMNSVRCKNCGGKKWVVSNLTISDSNIFDSRIAKFDNSQSTFSLNDDSDSKSIGNCVRILRSRNLFVGYMFSQIRKLVVQHDPATHNPVVTGKTAINEPSLLAISSDLVLVYSTTDRLKKQIEYLVVSDSIRNNPDRSIKSLDSYNMMPSYKTQNTRFEFNGEALIPLENTENVIIATIFEPNSDTKIIGQMIFENPIYVGIVDFLYETLAF